MSTAASAAAKTSALADEIATIRMELADSDPLIWREAVVPTSITLEGLHDVIQIVMGWCDYHLWTFEIDGRGYGVPMEDDWRDEPLRDAAKTRLRDVMKPGRRTEIGYTYDFGDNWEMRLVVSGVEEGEHGRHPSYVGGERNAPPEDCGGIPGFYDIVDALADEDHPDHDEATGAFAGYDPNIIDEEAIRHGLSRIANARKGAKRPAAKKS